MLTEYAVLASVTPICSAIAMNRLLNTSSSTGSAVVPMRVLALRRLDALEQQVVARGQRRAPARLDDRRRIALAQHGGAVDRVAGTQVVAIVDRRVVERAVRVHAVRARAARAVLPRGGEGRGRLVGRRLRRADGLDGDRLDHQRACPASGSRTAADSGARSPRRSARRSSAAGNSSVVSVPSYFTCSVRRHVMRGAAMPCARPRSGRASSSARERERRRLPAPRPTSARLQRLLAQRAHVGEPHPVRRQHAGERMDEHARHAERIGHEAGVLAAGAAEAAQRVLGHVVAALRPRCA